MLIQMKVIGIQIHPETKTPVVWLQEINGESVFPIWIGMLEATAIATELEEIKFPRPMTHDLLKNIIAELGAGVERVEVCDLIGNTFFARIYVNTAEKTQLCVDARPSDAIALALRMKVPIFVDDHVIHQLGQKVTDEDLDQNDEEGRKWKEMLDKLSPSEFSKYKM